MEGFQRVVFQPSQEPSSKLAQIGNCCAAADLRNLLKDQRVCMLMIWQSNNGHIVGKHFLNIPSKIIPFTHMNWQYFRKSIKRLIKINGSQKNCQTSKQFILSRESKEWDWWDFKNHILVVIVRIAQLAIAAVCICLNTFRGF